MLEFTVFEYDLEDVKRVFQRGKKATVGFEPTNNGFANRPLEPLGYVAKIEINLPKFNRFCN